MNCENAVNGRDFPREKNPIVTQLPSPAVRPVARRRSRETTSALVLVGYQNGSSVTFGVFVPQGRKLELASIEGPQAKWATAVEIAQLAEELGFDSTTSVRVPDSPHSWTSLAARRANRRRPSPNVGLHDHSNR